MKNFPIHLLLSILWCLHWLPLPFLRFIGRLLGKLLYRVGGERRHVTLINLKHCFPQKTTAAHEKMAKAVFENFACSVLDRTLGWWASPKRLEKTFLIEGLEHLQRDDKRPIILLTPHFMGLDAGGAAVSMRTAASTMYSRQKNPVFEQITLKGRYRFNQPLLFSRQEGLRRIVKTLKEGLPFYYLPDMDFGPKESIFVPFFGIPTATTPALSRLARMTNALVVPCITSQTKNGYLTSLLPPLENFPSESVEEDTARMNRVIEEHILTMPEHYFWLHKRFKTRPEGQPSFY